MTTTDGFSPIVGPQARVLILGTLPSKKSLETGQYYGHPQNVFWSIMGAIVGAGPDLAYPERTRALISCRIALWDVLASGARPGSMDADIDQATAEANDFQSFFQQQPALKLVCFNGQTAAKLFGKMAGADILPSMEGIKVVTMPSTSPAYAAMNFADKLKSWSMIKAFVAGAGNCI